MRRSPRTRWIAALAAAFALAGCTAGVQMATVDARPASSGRPHPSYYCYDCHGYRYFDPYYDWCAGYGFRYGWRRHPEVLDLYRVRYLGIRESHPEYGRYRYRAGYRQDRRYREPRSYEAWRAGEDGREGERAKVREKNPLVPGSDGRPLKGRERKEPRDGKPRDSLREGA